MTIVEWILLLNVMVVVVAVAAVVHGIWLWRIVERRLKSKDTTIELLKRQIQSQKEEIAKLKEEIAPAVAEQCRILNKHAEDTAAALHQVATGMERVMTNFNPVGVQLSQVCQGMVHTLQVLTNLATQLFTYQKMANEGKTTIQ